MAHSDHMGVPSSKEATSVDPNPIRLRPEQSLRLLGLLHAKSTLVWADVTRHAHITFRRCVDVAIEPSDLHRMQPCLVCAMASLQLQ
jgi:hypothetical protein